MLRISCLVNLLILFFACSFVSGNHRVKRIVGGKNSAKPPPDDPVVFVRDFNRYARVQGIRNDLTKVYSFLGLRYALPPTGYLRFSRPRYKHLKGDINATEYGPPCPQIDPYNSNRVVGDEDCLLLNIFTRQMPDGSAGLPVIVNMHSGGFRFGSAAQYESTAAANEGFVMVNIQYRLGTFGTFGYSSKLLPGNVAMYDMKLAERWVYDHISYFGGDRNRITGFGHSTAAQSVSVLGMQPMGRKRSHINGVIAMSGSPLSNYALDDNPTQSMEEICKIHGCPYVNETEFIKCLRNKSVEEIIMNDSKIQIERLHGKAFIEAMSGGVGFHPHVEEPNDDRSLPGILIEKPDDTIKMGEPPRIPILIGVAQHETGNGLTINKINDIWGSAQKFLDSLVDIFKVGFQSLIKVDEIVGKTVSAAIPGLDNLRLTDLLKIPPSLEPNEILQKLTECTTDLLFNLPAVLTAQLWGKSAPAFLYSFEYKGSTSKGINFLKGLPIVAGGNNPNFTGHGDELGYIFDVRDIFGNIIPNTTLTKPEDLKVRKNFFSLLKKFTKIADDTRNNIATDDNIFKSFLGKGTPFIKVSEELETSDNFRFCELSMWGVPFDPISSVSCEVFAKNLQTATAVLNNVQGGLTNTSSAVINSISNVMKPGGLVGFAAGPMQNPTSKKSNSNSGFLSRF